MFMDSKLNKMYSFFFFKLDKYSSKENINSLVIP